jgi:hypothetical protein
LAITYIVVGNLTIPWSTVRDHGHDRLPGIAIAAFRDCPGGRLAELPGREKKEKKQQFAPFHCVPSVTAPMILSRATCGDILARLMTRAKGMQDRLPC